jgi:hypothetical protein
VVQSAHPKQVMVLIDVTVWWCTIESMELQSFKEYICIPVNNSTTRTLSRAVADHDPDVLDDVD